MYSQSGPSGTRIASIGVIGGGTAGYISALYLHSTVPDVHVTLIESSRIPVIGVGESTTPLLGDFLHQKLGFPVTEFFAETKPTLKLGVRLEWGPPGESHYNNSFGKTDLRSALFHTGRVNDASLCSMLMDERHVPILPSKDGYVPVALPRGCAYHIDNRKFLAYLHRKLLESGCTYIDAEIDSVQRLADGSGVESVTTREGERYTFDLFVDCSGFRSLLLGKASGADWVDYSSSLKTDRAVIGTRSNHREIEPYTLAKTLNCGWLWKTPMQQEDHLGYVYSSAFCSDEEARAELRAHCETIQEERVISFRTGRYTESWRGNVVGIGNSFAFIEPLEATAIHMMLRQLRSLAPKLTRGVTDEGRDRYNRRVNEVWDQLRWFIALHYRFNSKLDTPFWRWCREEVDVSGVTDYIDSYMKAGPLSAREDDPLHKKMDRDAIFSVFLFDSTMAGLGVNREHFQQRSDTVVKDWPVVRATNRLLAKSALRHREALAVLERGECDLIRFDDTHL